MRCRGCGETVSVPEDGAPSDEERVAILSALGIDPDEATREYLAERRREDSTNRPRRYKCVRCSESMESSGELAGAYVKGELLCASCRAAGEVEERRPSETRREGPAVLAAVERAEPVAASARALALGTVVFLGFFGPLAFIFGCSWPRSLLVGVAIAVACGSSIYRNRV